MPIWSASSAPVSDAETQRTWFPIRRPWRAEADIKSARSSFHNKLAVCCRADSHGAIFSLSLSLSLLHIEVIVEVMGEVNLCGHLQGGEAQLMHTPEAHPWWLLDGLLPSCRRLIWPNGGRSKLWHRMLPSAISPATSRSLC
jgi:hypothetical protein